MPEPFVVTVSGTVTGFCDPDKSGRRPFRLQLSGSAVTVVVKSSGPLPKLGAEAVLTGVWERDALYGRHFAARKLVIL